MKSIDFEWDALKNLQNQNKHGVSFEFTQNAFLDRYQIIAKDMAHSEEEERYFCFGIVEEGILTVRFTFREETIRIFGAGYWRKGKKIYEKENNIQ